MEEVVSVAQRDKRRSKRNCLKVMVVATVVILVAVLVLPFFFMASTEEVDIHSGRKRLRVLFAGRQIWSATQETWLSRNIEPTTGPHWRLVSRRTPGSRFSPHCLYHGAIAQSELLDLMDQVVEFDPPVRKKVASQVLRLWQQGSYFEAAPFIHDLSKLVSSLGSRGATHVSEDDLASLNWFAETR